MIISVLALIALVFPFSLFACEAPSLPGAIEVRSVTEFQAIEADSDATYIQMADIDFAGESVSISNFEGKYYGNCFELSNGQIFRGATGSGSETDPRGLFQRVQNAVLHGITLRNLTHGSQAS